MVNKRTFGTDAGVQMGERSGTREHGGGEGILLRVLSGLGGRDSELSARRIAALAAQWSGSSDEEIALACRQALEGLSASAPRRVAAPRSRLPVVGAFLELFMPRLGRSRAKEDDRRLALAVTAFGRRPADLPNGSQLHATQIVTAAALGRGRLVQMDTGEGKTYAILGAGFVLACRYRTVLVVCANSYLAHRDAVRTRRFWDFVGLDVGLALPRFGGPDEWDARVVYTTLDELAFRRLYEDDGGYSAALDPSSTALILDEVDAIVLDQGSTSFQLTYGVASSPGGWEVALDIASRLRAGDEIEALDDPVRPDAMLTPEGEQLLVTLAGVQDPAALLQLRRDVELAYVARSILVEGRHYVLDGDDAVPLNPVDGTLMRGSTVEWLPPLRRKLGLPDRPLSLTYHQRSGLDVVREFTFSSGTSGTTVSEGIEYLLLLGKLTARAKPVTARQAGQRDDLIYSSHAEAIGEVIAQVDADCDVRPFLIAAPDIPTAVQVHSQLQDEFGERVRVLLVTGEDMAHEKLFAEAGQAGVVLVSTQVAGRGVDIRLDEDVRQAGGMILLALGHNLEARHDRQLLGRVGRRGDPYQALFLNSLDDPILRPITGKAIVRWGTKQSDTRELPALRRVIVSLQRIVRRDTIVRLRAQAAHDDMIADVEAARRTWLRALARPDDERVAWLVERFVHSNLAGALRSGTVGVEQAEVAASLIWRATGGIPDRTSVWLANQLADRNRSEVIEKLTTVFAEALKNAAMANGVALQDLQDKVMARQQLDDRIAELMAAIQRISSDRDEGEGIEVAAAATAPARSDYELDASLSSIAPPADSVTDADIPTLEAELTAVLRARESLPHPDERLLVRTPWAIERWTVRRASAAFIDALNALTHEAYQRQLPPLDYYRYLARRTRELWVAIEARLAGDVLGNLLRGGFPGHLDDLFWWVDHAAPSMPVSPGPAFDWSTKARARTWAAPTLSDDDIAAGLVRAFVVERRPRRPVSAAALTRLLTDFLERWPLLRLRVPGGPDEAFENWTRDQTEQTEKGAVPAWPRLVNRYHLLAFLRFLHARGHAAAPPTLRSRARSMRYRARESTRELGTVLALCLTAATICFFAIAMLMIPHGDTVGGGQLASVLDDLLIAGLLTHGSVVGAALAGLLACWILAAHLLGSDELTPPVYPVYALLAVSVQACLTAIIVPGGVAVAVVLTCAAVFAGRLIYVGLQVAQTASGWPWLMAVWVGASATLLGLDLIRSPAQAAFVVTGLVLSGAVAVSNVARIPVISAYSRIDFGSDSIDGDVNAGSADATVVDATALLATRQSRAVRTATQVPGRIGWLPHVYGLVLAWLSALAVTRATAGTSLERDSATAVAATLTYSAVVIMWSWAALSMRLAPDRWSQRLRSRYQRLDLDAPLTRALAHVRARLLTIGILSFAILLAGSFIAFGVGRWEDSGLPLAVVATAALSAAAATVPIIMRGSRALILGGGSAVLIDAPDMGPLPSEGLRLRLGWVRHRLAVRFAVVAGLLTLLGYAQQLSGILRWVLQRLEGVLNLFS